MGKHQINITQDYILAWADGLVGVSPRETGLKFGVSDQTIRNWQKKVAEWIAEKFDINEYRMPLYSLYPLMVNSLVHNLKRKDVQTTLNLLKGLQITTGDNITNNPTVNIGVQLAEKQREKRQEILNRFGVTVDGPEDNNSK